MHLTVITCDAEYREVLFTGKTVIKGVESGYKKSWILNGTILNYTIYV